jgi:CRP-like cAMP-binding protein
MSLVALLYSRLNYQYSTRQSLTKVNQYKKELPIMKYLDMFQAFNEFLPIPEKDWESLESELTEVHLKKGEHYIRPGQECHHYAIIIKGLFRLYYVDNDGKEFIKVFRFENQPLAPYAEMIQRIPSRTFIEAMENSTIATIKMDRVESLRAQNPLIDKLMYVITERLFIEKEKKEFELLQIPAAKRYELFIEENPDLVGRVSQYHIAAYLGITPVGLSRIINRK